jgi:hypothetical protein
MGIELVENGYVEDLTAADIEGRDREETLATTVVSMDSDILNVICDSYKDDTFFQPVAANPDRYPAYTFHGGLIYLRERLCTPRFVVCRP